MRILFLNQAPKRSAHYDPARIEAQLNTYASPGTKVEIVLSRRLRRLESYSRPSARRARSTGCIT